MRIGMPLPYGSGFSATVSQLADFERVGLDIAFVAEAYTFDSVSQLGYLAAKTSTVQLASGIFNVYSRSPSLLAMTAAGLDFVSDGRFTLGLGASGPQVIEGFHGMPYTAPLARTREVVDICRQVWRREPVVHDGPHFQLPLSKERGGTGLGKPLKLINHPVRSRIPMLLAALGPKNVALAAELFEGWEPLFFYPEGAQAAFGEALAEGMAKRDPDLGPLDIVVDTHLAVVEDEQERAAALDRIRAHLALYIGGMGAKGKNFYNELACRYGFEGEAQQVQDLFLGGDKVGAALALPHALVNGVAMIGSKAEIKDRVAAFADSGATTLNALPLAADHVRRVADVQALKDLCG